MKALFLLAGENSRMFPLNSISHKSMLKLQGKPILAYILEDLRDCGIKDFIFVVGKHGEKVKEYFEDGKKMGISIRYIQQNEPLGQGHALLQAANYIDEPFIIANPYHIGEKDLFKRIIHTFQTEKLEGILPAVHEQNINNYGALIVENETIKGIVEKPEPGKEPSNYRATSAYVFHNNFIDVLQKEPPHHYSFESAINTYAGRHTVKMFVIDKKNTPVSLKYPWHLLQIRKTLSNMKTGFISKKAKIAPTALIDDTVYIDDSAVIYDYACIKGHTYVGKNAVIGHHALIRDSDIGESAELGVYSDIARSVVMEHVHSHGGGFIGDSIIGSATKLAFGFTTANKRIDRETIHSKVKDKKINTSITTFGCVTGADVKTGIYVSTMPGVLIGEHSVIGPGAVVSKNVPSRSSLFVKQTQEIKSL